MILARMARGPPNAPSTPILVPKEHAHGLSMFASEGAAGKQEALRILRQWCNSATACLSREEHMRQPRRPAEDVPDDE